MKITKYFHSCILLEHEDRVVLLDPGLHTYNEQALDMSTMHRLDALVITHEHDDHFYMPMIQKILEKFPDVPIISSPSVVKSLKSEHITATSESMELLTTFQAAHEPAFDRPIQPGNFAITLFNLFTHPGDSLKFQRTTPVLAIPMLGPSWSMTQAIEKVLEVRPEFVVPIHDYNWKDSIRKKLYTRCENFLRDYNIRFYPMGPVDTIEISL